METKPKNQRATLRGETPLSVVEFKNPSGTVVWRVTGILPSGERVRKNFQDRDEAIACRMDYERKISGWASVDVPRLTHLTDEQLRAAESVLTQLDGNSVNLTRAVKWWIQTGQNQHHLEGDAVTLGTAFERFSVWVEKKSSYRTASITSYLTLIGKFVEGQETNDVSSFTPETIEAWLEALPDVTMVTKDNYRRAIVRFFAWCIERPQRFIHNNPAKEVRLRIPETGVPEIYTVAQVRNLLQVASSMYDGRWLKPIVLQVFCGLRPFESFRLQDHQINLDDAEIRVEGIQSKMKRSRTVHIEPTALAWLKICKGKRPVTIYNGQWYRLRTAAGLPKWIPDGLRHTAISHYFRKTGSYGRTGEWAGNTEPIIKKHYQGRVTSAECAEFWALTPEKLATPPTNVVSVPFTDKDNTQASG